MIAAMKIPKFNSNKFAVYAGLGVVGYFVWRGIQKEGESLGSNAKSFFSNFDVVGAFNRNKDAQEKLTESKIAYRNTLDKGIAELENYLIQNIDPHDEISPLTPDRRFEIENLLAELRSDLQGNF